MNDPDRTAPETDAPGTIRGELSTSLTDLTDKLK
jgi:hypothetical protein